LIAVSALGSPMPVGCGLKVATGVADRPNMDISAIAIQGLDQAQAALEQAAIKIAKFGADATGNSDDVVDLSAEMVALMAAKNAFSVNLKVLKTAEEVQKSTIDVSA
jgi:hypothetical protein